MARNFNQKKQANSGARFSRQLLLVLAAFLIGYLTATVFSFTELSQWLSKRTSTAEKKPVDARKHRESPKPKFEFYTLLSKDNKGERGSKVVYSKQPSTGITNHAVRTNVTVQSSIPSALKAVETKTKASAAHNDKYIIQVASFSKNSDAQSLKASLLLRGFDTSISAFTHNGSSWYRVVLGPYSSQVAAEKAQSTLLQSDKLKGMIRKIQG